MKLLHLTKFFIRIPHGAREKTVRNQWVKAEIDKKWNETQWAKKRAAKALVIRIQSDFVKCLDNLIKLCLFLRDQK